MVYNIDSNYLITLLKARSNSIVGRVLKRIEIIEDKEILKREIKELIHEEMRNVSSTIEAYHNGAIFKLEQKDNPKG